MYSRYLYAYMSYEHINADVSFYGNDMDITYLVLSKSHLPTA